MNCSQQEKLIAELSAGQALRHVLFNKLTPIMLCSEKIEEASTRLLIQDCCSEIGDYLEQLIKKYELDQKGV